MHREVHIPIRCVQVCSCNEVDVASSVKQRVLHHQRSLSSFVIVDREVQIPSQVVNLEAAQAFDVLGQNLSQVEHVFLVADNCSCTTRIDEVLVCHGSRDTAIGIVCGSSVEP
eukprot:2142560-Rhodomonas_salina.1